MGSTSGSGAAERSDDLGSRLQDRLQVLQSRLLQLLRSPALKFDKSLRHTLPEAHGIYRIFDPKNPEVTIRAGRTKTAAGGLRQRTYGNHLMGYQKGNLRAQLVSNRVCPDMDAAKQFIQNTLVVQFRAIEPDQERIWSEHFMLAVLQPRYCD